VEVSGVFKSRPEGSKIYQLPDKFFSPDEDTNWNIWVWLSNGEIVGCDLMIEATGSVPNSGMWKRDCNEVIYYLNGYFPPI
jgi:hypothetical protein